MKRPLKILFCATIIILLSALVPLLWALSHAELYCAFWPSIDTKYAKGYTEAAFTAIRVGMPQSKVYELLGPPFRVDAKADGTAIWRYTRDGDGCLYDFAWLGRAVWIRNGQVERTEKRVYYD